MNDKINRSEFLKFTAPVMINYQLNYSQSLLILSIPGLFLPVPTPLRPPPHPPSGLRPPTPPLRLLQQLIAASFHRLTEGQDPDFVIRRPNINIEKIAF